MRARADGAGEVADDAVHSRRILPVKTPSYDYSRPKNNEEEETYSLHSVTGELVDA